MNVTDLESYIRRRYNAVNDTRFFTSAELYQYIWDAQMQLARESWCIRSVFSTTSVASQQEYSFPSRTISIKRVTYDGIKVEPRALDEVLNLTGSVAAPTGRPYIYAIWNEVIYFGPIPDADALTIKIFSINEPDEVTVSSALDVPTRYHLDLSEYAVWKMCLKDKNYEGAARHEVIWNGILQKAKAFERKMMRGDRMSFMTDSDRDVDSWIMVR